MTITFTHISGVGVNSRSAIYRDGVQVGTIERHGMTACRICSVHNYEELGQYKNVARAREVALTLYFPSEREIYETICARVEKARRSWKEKELRRDIMQAVYDLANGSNSAQSRLIELAAEINAFAIDRNWTAARCSRRAIDTGTYVGSEPTYPEPPQELAA